ncbi:MerR family transcriptional regulator [Pseudomonas entomophila]|uniref:MerR family transcriptional regulator n=1 Tax=Pseudomonas entomophila TaxID=312306 RepID=UPI0023D844BB|nr:MerR family transcriptional regulator [Pseudomonas entomophila]MDF0732746.1 MerR family transcriptional regulator [Pseudomonas entomophila]
MATNTGELLQVGTLARRCQVTIRALHHYDVIGLIRPATRTAAGYRLYPESAVQQVRAIQSLQAMGLSLESIGQLMCSPGNAEEAGVTAQLARLDEEIAQLARKREKLAVLEAGLSIGLVPGNHAWPGAMALLERYRAQFSEAELLAILSRWSLARDTFTRLFAQARAAMALGLRADSVRVQRLAARWMDASMQWMNGDLLFARRWGALHDRAGLAADHTGLDGKLLAFMRPALELRLDALRRHLTEDDLLRLDKTLASHWAALGRRAQYLKRLGAEASPGDIAELLERWRELVHRMSAGDAQLACKLRTAYAVEPLLRIGHPIPKGVRAWIMSRLQESA